MENSTRAPNITDDPKFLLLDGLRRHCYTENTTHSEIVEKDYNEDGEWCPRVFDGFSCWDETPGSSTAFQTCPGFIIVFDPRRYVYKRCMENGTWSVHPQTNKAWTNYTTCVDVDDLDFRSIVNAIYVGGYSLSVAALVLSIMIFLCFRTLQCTRIRIHMHLFSSFTLNNILWIVWYRTVVNNPSVVQENQEWCQALHIITHYFMVASYIWMFCESLHLHVALVVVFVKDEVAIRWFLALGWGLSMIIILVYASVRYYLTDDAVRCWVDHSDTVWIITAPVGISLLVSFVFLINVVRVLLTKLHPAPNQHVSLAAKKAARAALILIPLFGLHFVIIPLRPLHDTPGENVYQIVSALLTSLQGVCVAILFCFTNHDVITAIRTFKAKLRGNEGIAMTGKRCFTGGESLMNTRDHVV